MVIILFNPSIIIGIIITHLLTRYRICGITFRHILSNQQTWVTFARSRGHFLIQTLRSTANVITFYLRYVKLFKTDIITSIFLSFVFFLLFYAFFFLLLTVMSPKHKLRDRIHRKTWSHAVTFITWLIDS